MRRCLRRRARNGRRARDNSRRRRCRCWCRDRFAWLRHGRFAMKKWLEWNHARRSAAGMLQLIQALVGEPEQHSLLIPVLRILGSAEIQRHAQIELERMNLRLILRANAPAECDGLLG